MADILARAERQAQNRITAQSSLRRQRLVERLHRLGPYPLYHFLAEIEAGAVISDRLERYARLDPEFVRAMGGSEFVPALLVINGGRQP